MHEVSLVFAPYGAPDRALGLLGRPGSDPHALPAGHPDGALPVHPHERAHQQSLRRDPMTDHPTNGGPRPRARRPAARSAPTRSRRPVAHRAGGAHRAARARARRGAAQQTRSTCDNWQRSAADFANYKRRTDEERATLGQFSNAVLIGKLLERPRRLRPGARDGPGRQAHDPWVEGVRARRAQAARRARVGGRDRRSRRSASRSTRTCTRRSSTRTPPTIPTTK